MNNGRLVWRKRREQISKDLIQMKPTKTVTMSLVGVQIRRVTLVSNRTMTTSNVMNTILKDSCTPIIEVRVQKVDSAKDRVSR